MTPVLARELAGRDVTVNAVAPGPTATPLFLEGKSQDLIDRKAAGSPAGRLGAPEDIAQAVAFLAGPAGRHRKGCLECLGTTRPWVRIPPPRRRSKAEGACALC